MLVSLRRDVGDDRLASPCRNCAVQEGRELFVVGQRGILQQGTDEAGTQYTC